MVKKIQKRNNFPTFRSLRNKMGREELVFVPKNTPKWWNIWVTSENGFFWFIKFWFGARKGVKCENWRFFRNYGILKSLTMENTSKIKYILYLNDISEVENLYYEGWPWSILEYTTNTKIYKIESQKIYLAPSCSLHIYIISFLTTRHNDNSSLTTIIIINKYKKYCPPQDSD